MRTAKIETVEERVNKFGGGKFGGGSLIKYSESIGSTYQQQQRYIKMGCIYVDGIMYRPVVKQG